MTSVPTIHSLEVSTVQKTLGNNLGLSLLVRNSGEFVVGGFTVLQQGTQLLTQILSHIGVTNHPIFGYVLKYTKGSALEPAFHA